MRPGSTEYAIFLQFDIQLHAYNPLDQKDRLLSLPIPVSFYFGDIDWMLTDAGQKIVDANVFKGIHSNVFIIEKSDHHLYFDNPEGFVHAIRKDLKNVGDIKKTAH
jgi:pimeloyl-ACP methyl ester carboxylesterase